MKLPNWLSICLGMVLTEAERYGCLGMVWTITKLSQDALWEVPNPDRSTSDPVGVQAYRLKRENIGPRLSSGRDKFSRTWQVLRVPKVLLPADTLEVVRNDSAAGLQTYVLPTKCPLTTEVLVHKHGCKLFSFWGFERGFGGFYRFSKLFDEGDKGGSLVRFVDNEQV
ncbi:hypothetical protein TSUD_369440 [Trifolium subterraneum]|uniref:Uncharacterized protein n=1 Tax=Trifolium subterraneum TaxID=3900 RepID=A0A2Z6PD09_TRISU|nr:hypothetical protein TSUD_369440 [Trifolium subterraneum]